MNDIEYYVLNVNAHYMCDMYNNYDLYINDFDNDDSTIYSNMVCMITLFVATNNVTVENISIHTNLKTDKKTLQLVYTFLNFTNLPQNNDLKILYDILYDIITSIMYENHYSF